MGILRYGDRVRAIIDDTMLHGKVLRIEKDGTVAVRWDRKDDEYWYTESDLTLIRRRVPGDGS